MTGMGKNWMNPSSGIRCGVMNPKGGSLKQTAVKTSKFAVPNLFLFTLNRRYGCNVVKE
jgi:hypothetical protein